MPALVEEFNNAGLQVVDASLDNHKIVNHSSFATLEADVDIDAVVETLFSHFHLKFFKRL